MHVFVSKIYSSDVCLFACFLRSRYKRTKTKKKIITIWKCSQNPLGCSLFHSNSKIKSNGTRYVILRCDKYVLSRVFDFFIFFYDVMSETLCSITMTVNNNVLLGLAVDHLS